MFVSECVSVGVWDRGGREKVLSQERKGEKNASYIWLAVSEDPRLAC